MEFCIHFSYVSSPTKSWHAGNYSEKCNKKHKEAGLIWEVEVTKFWPSKFLIIYKFTLFSYLLKHPQLWLHLLIFRVKIIKDRYTEHRLIAFMCQMLTWQWDIWNSNGISLRNKIHQQSRQTFLNHVHD